MLFSLNLNVQKLKKLIPNPENIFLRNTEVQNLPSNREISTSKNANDPLDSFSMVKFVVIVINYPFNLEAVECERILFC